MSARGRGRAMMSTPRGGIGTGRGSSPVLFNSEKMQFLRKESKVEVSSDKDGLGIWFIAKIVNHSPRTTKGKRKNQVFVQYDDLVDSDKPNVPLIEGVHPSYIRPLPPPISPDQIYEQNDVVDAFHRGGWWKGVVNKVSVFEDNKRSYNVVFDCCEESSFCSKDLRFHFEWINGHWVKSPKQLGQGPNEQEVGQENGNGQPSKRKRELNVQVMSQQVPTAVVENNGEEHNVSEGIAASETDMEVCAVSFADQTTEVGASPTQIPTQIVSVTDHTTEVGASRNTVNDDLALSTCLTRDDEILSQPCVINVEASNNEQLKNPEMPFTKTSFLWQSVESLEVFKVLPQNPHFSLLSEENEETREGFAIGNLWNFASLVEKVSKLKISDPRSVFDTYLKALDDLEKHGFNVKAVVDRINKLWLAKTREEEAKNQSEGFDSKIEECDSEKTKLEEEVNEIKKKITELEEQLATKVLQKVAKDSESNVLRKDFSSFKEEILNADLDFEREAAAPWKPT